MSDVASKPLIKVRNLSRTFDVSKPLLNRVREREGRKYLHAVQDVSFDIPEKGIYALVGESGSGKSTIGRMIVDLLGPTDGSIEMPAGTRVQMIFQSPFASMNPRWKVRDIIAEPIQGVGRNSKEAAQRVEDLLEQVGLSGADAEKFPHEFSGGQRQRIAVARALAAEPAFIVCDAPTSALDVSVQAQVLNLMRDLQARLGLSYLEKEADNHNLS